MTFRRSAQKGNRKKRQQIQQERYKKTYRSVFKKDCWLIRFLRWLKKLLFKR